SVAVRIVLARVLAGKLDGAVEFFKPVHRDEGIEIEESALPLAAIGRISREQGGSIRGREGESGEVGIIVGLDIRCQLAEWVRLAPGVTGPAEIDTDCGYGLASLVNLLEPRAKLMPALEHDVVEIRFHGESDQPWIRIWYCGQTRTSPLNRDLWLAGPHKTL